MKEVMPNASPLVFSILNDDEFEQFSATHPQNNFVQSLGIVRSQRKRGASVELVGVKRGDTIIAAGSLVYKTNRLGYTTCLCQQGPLLDYNDAALRTFFFDSLTAHLKQKSVGELTISPYIVYQQRDSEGDVVPDGEDNAALVNTLQAYGFRHHGFAMNFANINWMFVKDLTGIHNEDELLMSLSYRTRKAVRKAQKNGVFIEQATLETLDDFYTTVQEASRDKGFVNRSRAYYQSILESTDARTAKLLTAKIDLTAYRQYLKTALQDEEAAKQQLQANPAATSKKLLKKIKVSEELIDSYQKSLSDIQEFRDTEGTIALASIYFVCHGSEVVCVIGGSRQKYLYFNGATLLYWHMLVYALEHGYNTYNFYGTFGIEDEAATGHGVYEFKKGFGGHVVQLVGEFTLPINHLKYRLFHGTKKLARLRHSISRS